MLLASVRARGAIESQLNTGNNKPKGLSPKIKGADLFYSAANLHKHDDSVYID